VLLCGLLGKTRSRGKGLPGIVVLCCLLFAFVTPTLTLGQAVTPNPVDGSYEWIWMGGHNTVASSGGWAGVYNTTRVVCLIFCTSEIVSVAQRVIDMPRRRSRGCGKVGSALCFPLFHAPEMLRSAMPPAPAICSQAMSVV